MQPKVELSLIVNELKIVKTPVKARKKLNMSKRGQK